MLKINNLHTRYGSVEALKGVSLHVEQGEIVTLVGANGAGKTTLLMTICGDRQPSAGSMEFMEQDITNWPSHKTMCSGMSISPEGRRVFPRMTVLENMQLGCLDEQYFKEDLARCYDLFPRLKEREHQRAGTMSGGEQQMLAISRALMARPKLLLLDEPSLGLAPLIVKQIFEIIKEINSQGITVLLVEQNAVQALKVANRGYVLANGQITLAGDSAELLANPEVKAAYLEGAH